MSDKSVFEKTFVSQGPDETFRLGEKISEGLLPKTVICLYGDLGSGKTVLTKGIAKGFDIDPNEVKSPSFSLINEYRGSLTIYHMDVYRLLKPELEMEELGFLDMVYGEGITIIEWADKMTRLLPEERVDIFFSFKEESVRTIKVSAKGEKFTMKTWISRNPLCPD